MMQHSTALTRVNSLPCERTPRCAAHTQPPSSQRNLHHLQLEREIVCEEFDEVAIRCRPVVHKEKNTGNLPHFGGWAPFPATLY